MHGMNIHAGRIDTGAAESSIMCRYDAEVQGVIVKCTSVKIKESCGTIIEDFPSIYCLVVMKVIVFKPAVGSRIGA